MQKLKEARFGMGQLKPFDRSGIRNSQFPDLSGMPDGAQKDRNGRFRSFGFASWIEPSALLEGAKAAFGL
ncbi:hypothetical protein Ancab_039466 [Ancistrocladus abbreviatus]